MELMPELEIVEVATEDLVEYVNNAKLHPAEQIDQIAESIEKFGFNNPILAWHNDEGEPEIVAGHGRLMAARKLGIEKLPVVFLDHMDEEQRRAYILVDNQLTMNSGFDIDILQDELDAILDIDMSDFGFIKEDMADILEPAPKYTQKIGSPIYEIKGDSPEVTSLYDDSKYIKLVNEINESNIDERTKAFLLLAATRHISFDYGSIAEFYAHQSQDVKRLMEDSTLVIVDFDKAIELGLVRASQALDELMEVDVLNETS